MTRVKIWKDGVKYYVEVCGHNSDTRICAMISALVAMLEGYLENEFCNKYSYREEDGKCSFEIPAEAYTAVCMFAIGVLRIEKTYPKNVSAIAEI